MKLFKLHRFDSLIVSAMFCLLFSCQSNYRHSYSNQSVESSASSVDQETFKTNDSVIYRKNNLETLAIGRNRMEVEKLMGPPDGRSLDGGNGYLWDYRRAVFDESMGKVFSWSLVSFKFLKGKCAYVKIQLEDPPVLPEQVNTSFSAQ